MRALVDMVVKCKSINDVDFVDWLMKFQLLTDFVVNCVMLTMRARYLTDSVLMRCAFIYCCVSGKKPHQGLL